MKKAGALSGKVLFLHQDMRQIRLPVPVDLATSMFDSLNHVTTRRDLLRTFRGVARALRPGGVFMFDVNNERCYRRLWTQTGTMEHRDFLMILHSRYEAARRRATCLVTIFTRENERYTRSGEVVEERYYPREEVSELLVAAGFRVVECEDFNFTEAPEVGNIKTWYVARKES
jgi:SAM-dependent methyltransferase